MKDFTVVSVLNLFLFRLYTRTAEDHSFKVFFYLLLNIRQINFNFCCETRLNTLRVTVRLSTTSSFHLLLS